MSGKALDTSITDTAARRFLNEADDRATLWCDKVSGFHLLKTLKGGSWRYRYTDLKGRRRVATVGRYPSMKPQEAAEKAQAWRNDRVDVLSEQERDREAQKAAERLAKHRTLGKYIEGPYARYQARKKAGDETLAILRNNFAAWLDRDMATFSRADVLEWQAKREGEGRAHATLTRAFGALKTLMRHAVREGFLDENPLDGVTLERPTDTERAAQLSAERSSARRLLTDDEIQGLHTGLSAFADEVRAQRRNSRKHGRAYLPDLDAVAYPHWFIPFAYCALYTGMRPGDLYSLTWLELNVNFGRLVKVPEKTRHHPDPARITMDLPPELLRIMRAWWEQQGKPESGLVFPSPVNGERMDKKAHLRAWARVKRLGGLPENLTFYALRHHFISALVSAGVPLLTVAHMAGHKSASMIERHYGHLCPVAAADALAAFSRTVARRERA
ncbi:integrase family protein [Sediminicurvatus halobius]|uniref:Integrase n=1 Tax=Sediminicurvatus halobius TaxID=2182432 RepID=A0A2U2MZC1_9GAMM|nr:integrase family protein [Spiribacter halobius]PWG62335.1 integrase [Spiribacter halobius]UEX79742.1 integrase family protein [Spiribacter halobius]